MAKKKSKKKLKKKSLTDRITILEIKVDIDFFDKILNSFESFVTGLTIINGKLDDLNGRLGNMERKITKIETKIKASEGTLRTDFRIILNTINQF